MTAPANSASRGSTQERQNFKDSAKKIDKRKSDLTMVNRQKS